MTLFQWIAEYDFVRHALVASVAIGTACSLLSVVVVLKRMAFIGQGISHAGFGGVGTAALLGLGGLVQDGVILLFCLLAAFAIGALSTRRRLERDTSIGILLVAGMAWGVFADNLRVSLQAWPWYVEHVGTLTRTNYESLLFGSLISMSHGRMWLAVALSVAVLLLSAAFFKEILFYSFDETVSRVFGVPTRLVHYLLLVLLTVTIVVSIRLAGFVLISALLVIPGAAALQLSHRLGRVLLIAWVIGTAGTVGGLLLSLALATRQVDFASGPCVVGVLCVLFAVTYAVGSVRGVRRG